MTDDGHVILSGQISGDTFRRVPLYKGIDRYLGVIDSSGKPWCIPPDWPAENRKQEQGTQFGFAALCLNVRDWQIYCLCEVRQD